jgi:TIR domain
MDLDQAGLDCWLDTQNIPSCSADWEQEITSQIQQCNELIHLISPESLHSDPVTKETQLAIASGLAVRRLSLTAIDTLPPSIQKEQVHDWSCRMAPYRAALRALLREHNREDAAPPDLLASLNSADFKPHPHHHQVLEGPRLQHAGFASSWVDVTPYTCSWLVCPDDWRGKAPDAVAVLFRFTGSIERETLQEVLVHRLAAKASPWIFVVEGHQPNQQSQFLIPNQSSHIWADCLLNCTRLLNHPMIKRRNIDLYLDCPSILALKIGQSIDRGRILSFYQFDRTDSSYQRLAIPG